MPTCGATSSVPPRNSTIPCHGSPRRTAMPTSTVNTRSLKSAVASRGVVDEFPQVRQRVRRLRGEQPVVLGEHRPARARRLLGADLGDRRAERAVADDLVRIDGFGHAEPLPGQHADDRVDVRDHALDPERTVEELAEQRRLGDERVVAVAGPLQQPLRPVLAVVDRNLDLRGGVLGAEPHEVVAPSTWWYSPGTLTPRRSATAFIVTRSRPISYAARAIIARSMRAGRPTFGRGAPVSWFMRLPRFRTNPNEFSKKVLETRADDKEDSPCAVAVHRARLRPVRRSDRRGAVRGLAPAPRRRAALLQRAVRLLCAEPVRGRARGVARLADLQLGARHGPGADRPDPAAQPTRWRGRPSRRQLRDDDLHGPARATTSCGGW